MFMFLNMNITLKSSEQVYIYLRIAKEEILLAESFW